MSHNWQLYATTWFITKYQLKIWIIDIFGELCGHFGQNFDENCKNQRVFNRFGPNLVCSIPVGVSKIIMRETFYFCPFYGPKSVKNYDFRVFLLAYVVVKSQKNQNFLHQDFGKPSMHFYRCKCSIRSRANFSDFTYIF